MGARSFFRGSRAASVQKVINTDFGTDFDAPELVQGISITNNLPLSYKTSRGKKWSFIRGSWGISQSKITSTNAADYPITIVDALVPDVSISLVDIGNGAGASIWVTDSGNWWGVGVYQEQTSCNCSTCVGEACSAYGCNSYGCTATGCTSTGCTSAGCTSTGCTATGCTGTGCTGYSSSCSGYTKMCVTTGCTSTGCKGYGCTGYGCAAYAGTYCVAYGCKSYGCTGGYGCTGYGCTAYANYCNSYTNSCSGYGCTAYGCTATGCTGYGCTGYGCTGYGCTTTGCTGYGCSSSYSYNYACNCQTCYPAYVRLIQSVANQVSTVTTWAVSQVVKSLKVKTKGKQITVESFSDTNLQTSIQSNTYDASTASQTSKFGLLINPSGYDERKNVSKIKIERNK